MFDYIDTITQREDAERRLLRALLTKILDRSLSVIVIRMKPSLLEKRRYKEQILVRGRGLVLLSFTRPDRLSQLMSIINNIDLLHYNRISFVIGTLALPGVLREKYASLGLTLEVVRKNAWPADVKEQMLGGLDALDDDISIAGTQVIREIVDLIKKDN